jgi:hypothetical protein
MESCIVPVLRKYDTRRLGLYNSKDVVFGSTNDAFQNAQVGNDNASIEDNVVTIRDDLESTISWIDGTTIEIAVGVDRLLSSLGLTREPEDIASRCPEKMIKKKVAHQWSCSRQY